MAYYFLNAHGAKRNAEYFMNKMADKMPSHINTVYDAQGTVVWSR